jgi:hypothetical protein
MLRGRVEQLWHVGALGALAATFIGLAWVLLRRAMRSA